MEGSLYPSCTLDAIFGSENVYSQRISPTVCTWLPLSEVQKDMMTGGAIAIAGSMPYICSTAVSNPAALQLLMAAGLPVSEKHLLRFCDSDDYVRLVRKQCGSGKTVAAQYLHGESELPTANCCIQPSVLSFLNNKANMSALVDGEYLPRRTVLPSAKLVDFVTSQALPFVVKVATDEPTGAGLDVVICESLSDSKRAEDVFRSCRTVIVEEFLPISRNLCLNYTIAQSGAITFLGCAEQVSDAQGIYQGNWLGKDISAPAEAVAIGERIARAGFTMGYYGFLGIDMAVLDDDRIKVFDLNFRINGSTAPLLLAESVMQRFARPLIRLERFAGRATYRDMLDIAYRELAKGTLVPLSSFDPDAVGCSASQPRLIAMLLGNTKDDIDEYKRELAATGLMKATYQKEQS